MRKTALVGHGALLFAAMMMTNACGGSGDLPHEGQGISQGRITALGPAMVDGCSFDMAFDIVAPAAIDMVGIVPLEGFAAAPTLSLFAVDAFGSEQLVAQEASAISGTTASLLGLSSSSETSVLADDMGSLHQSNQTASVGSQDAILNEALLTTSDSGFYARDMWGDQALLADSLAEAGWAPEPIAQVSLPWVAASYESNETTILREGADSNAGFFDTAAGMTGMDAITGFDSAAEDSTLWSSKSVEAGIGRLNIREAWGGDSTLASQSGVDSVNAFTNAAAVSTGAQSTGYVAEQSIANALSFSALGELGSQRFVLRLSAQAIGNAAGLRVFQGVESALFAVEEASILLPGCGI